MFKSGKLQLLFETLSNVDVYLSAGTDKNNATISFGSSFQDPIKQGKVYELDIVDGSIFIMVVPKEDKDDTLVEFLFWVNGEENSQITRMTLKLWPTTKGKLIFALLIIVLLAIIILVGLGIWQKT